MSTTDTWTAAASIDAMAGDYLSFRLSNEDYGIEILRVREIIGLVAITPLPKTAAFVKGVINLRGRILPVVDLRLQLGMAATAYTNETCIVVVDVERDGDGEGQVLQVGCIVDSVSEVLSVAADAIEAPPACLRMHRSSLQGPSLKGLVKLERSVLILLDINRVMHSVQFEDLRAQASA